jgi:predicted nucleic acid-binding protein
MRVVLDSNILARATPGRSSAAREVLLYLTRQRHTLVTARTSATILLRVSSISPVLRS